MMEDRMKNKSFLFKFISAIIAAIIISFILFVIPSNYYMISPGMAKEISPMVSIEAKTYPSQGEIMLTAVTMKGASLLEYGYVKIFKPKLVELQSKDFLPPDVDMKEYFEMMREMMKESQLQAKAVALEEAGYNPKITAKGAKVVSVLEKGDAYGKLKKDDVIVAVDDQPVGLITETVNKIQSRNSGDMVKITVKRDDEKKNYSIKTKSLQENSNKPSIGVLITSYKRDYDFPIKIDIDAGAIGGPSAGSMFTLDIYNKLTKKDITKGLKIAGTGTIGLDGSVGEIDGIKQKIVAAQKKGAEMFFAPAGNIEEAEELKAKGIEIVAVSNFKEIIRYLNGL